MQKTRALLSCLLVVTFCVALVGCGTMQGHQLVGTLIGAGLGAAIGGATGNPSLGAAIGAASGFAGGTATGLAQEQMNIQRQQMTMEHYRVSINNPPSLPPWAEKDSRYFDYNYQEWRCADTAGGTWALRYNPHTGHDQWFKVY